LKLGSELSTSIWVKFRKRKYVFVKDYITQNIDSTSRGLKALITFVMITITKEHTLLGTESKFSRIIWSKIRPASAPKNTKERIVW